MNIRIREGSLEEMVSISKQIPEFENPYKVDEYHKRLSGKNHLLLLAEVKGRPVGFKAGYEWNHKTFYSWMGGVSPQFRNKGVADALAKEQQQRILEMGYTAIRIKTRNYHKAMIHFLLKDGFFIVDIEKKEAIKEFRIIFGKSLQTQSKTNESYRNHRDFRSG